MSNETMTVTEILERIEAFMPMGRDSPTYTAVATRLRGEAAQGEQQAVACIGCRRALTNYCDRCAAELDRPQPAAVAVAVAGDAVQSDFVTIESHWLQNILSAAALLEGTGSILDRREAEALRKMAKSAKPAAPAPVAGDAVACDHVWTVGYLGSPKYCTCCGISKTLADSSPPNGAGAVEQLIGQWRRAIRAKLENGEDGAVLQSCMTADLIAALAQDRASQGAAAGVPEGWRLVPEKPTQHMLERGWGYGERIDSSYDRAGAYADLIAAAPSAPTQGAEREVG